MAHTYVYFMRRGDFVKIGKAHNPVRRRSELQTGFPERVILLGWILADETEERVLHRRFADHHESGEWFRWCDELAAFAATLTPYDGVEPPKPPYEPSAWEKTRAAAIAAAAERRTVRPLPKAAPAVVLPEVTLTPA